MEFIRTIRERQQTARQEGIMKEAEEVITLADFDNTLYIAYHGTPLLGVQEDWTPKQILEQLNIVRQNYINSQFKKHSCGMAVL